MEQNTASGQLISKKELLEKYKISYGALYRWKRKGLIPEDWFIKKATSTGQETFFPAEAVCERIELILSQKEDVLLDDLANRLNHEEKNNRSLLLVTAFGDKRFRISDIRGIRLENGRGEADDLTDQIMALIANYNNEQA